MTPRAFLVDLDGTLYRHAPVRLCMAAELVLDRQGWDAWRVLRVFRQEHESLRSARGAEGDPFEVQLQRTADRVRRPVREVEAAIDEWMLRRPLRWVALARRRALLREIAGFRRAGGATAVVSDYPAAEKLGAIGAAELFDVVVSPGSPEAPRRLKPWPDGYLLAAKRLRVEPADCLVIGDREDADGRAARAAGMGFRRI